VNDLQLTVTLVAIVAALLYAFRHSAAVFVVRIREGRAKAVRGTITPAFLATIEQLCAEHGIHSGEVRGVARGRRISLCFSRGLPLGFCQPLRNWWAMSGWSARSSRS